MHTTRLIHALLGAFVLTPVACRSETPPIPSPPPSVATPWLKGQLHAHTSSSGDSDTAPADVLRWYKAHGFDFVVLTDHNVVTAAPSAPGILAIPGVEITQNLRRCDPSPDPGHQCLIHLNALFVPATAAGPIAVGSEEGATRTAILDEGLRAGHHLTGLLQLNHPNFHLAEDASLIRHAAAHGVTLLEIANEAWDSNNDGGPDHPSTEELWNAALDGGAHLFGTATDDAHHYDDASTIDRPFVGDRGYVMVQAARDPAAIRAAIARGDFYATNGVLLAAVERSADAIGATLADTEREDAEFVVIGAGGRERVRRVGRGARFALADLDSPWVRLEVRRRDGKKAWAQPVWRP